MLEGPKKSVCLRSLVGYHLSASDLIGLCASSGDSRAGANLAGPAAVGSGMGWSGSRGGTSATSNSPSSSCISSPLCFIHIPNSTVSFCVFFLISLDSHVGGNGFNLSKCTT